ncbi:hypothetical protein E4T42_03319 [Aureobasidium subglaciale]|nr:hypothetical protein E4T38_00300 [Aureobasidium subglaciale]KAI5232492.1 hypothetical protein E4T40_00299 [Aureobasidium subglaciale]KAI5234655.1 hypothetical protein E4T41_00299 [Aureobasidium subglaciale]KAI5252609.1 hypothetical protein E4T42_03319 [Aureobasidium subglaciale]KAI5268475.1 hypothetical protein E4T46_00299 [Aureobasidium subglaciale]
MSRRLWWEIVLLDSFASKQCGVTSTVSCMSLWDTKRPSNVNDTDLHPEMCEVPKDYRGITEMSFCSARSEVAELTIAYSFPSKSSRDISEADAKIDGLQQRLEDRLLQYCDPNVPIHSMLRLFGKGALARIKLSVRRHHMYGSAGLSLEERNKTFLLCLQLAEAPNNFAKDKTVQRFLWQANAFFPLDAFMFMLGEMVYRTPQQPLPVPEEVVWTEIEKAFELHPRLTRDESAIYSAVRNLTIKAWVKSSRRHAEHDEPRFIKVLGAKSPSHALDSTQRPVETDSLNQQKNPTTNTTDASDFDFDIDSLDPSWSKIAIPNDPEFWEYWQQFAELPTP